jgi:hypothetical protein
VRNFVREREALFHREPTGHGLVAQPDDLGFLIVGLNGEPVVLDEHAAISEERPEFEGMDSSGLRKTEEVDCIGRAELPEGALY